MDYAEFVSGKKTLLIAPAGYGKTYTIVECLKHTTGLQLILTHTHAGVASIKEKLKKEKVPANKYNIETISSFAQRYVHSFYNGTDIPEQDDKKYHPFIIEKSLNIFKSPLVKKILSSTNTGLFVDEYQDCSKNQHAMIMLMADILPTHILGDPLQAIFDFNGEVVDFDNDLTDFVKFPELETPNRWYQEGNNSGLGNKIKEIRSCLLHGKNIDLTKDESKGIDWIKGNSGEVYNRNSAFFSRLSRLIIERNINSLLIITPPNKAIQTRALLRSNIDFSKSLIVLEALDDKDFYVFAKQADSSINSITTCSEKVAVIYELLKILFNKSPLDKWFSNDHKSLAKRRQEPLKSQYIELDLLINTFIDSPSPRRLRNILKFAKECLKLEYQRDELLYSAMHSLKAASLDNISVYDAMKKNRNIIRRIGRKVQGKYIGTTLLTKGLEFDTVAILEAHEFESPKDLYVALSRGCKKLYIFSNTQKLSPY